MSESSGIPCRLLKDRYPFQHQHKDLAGGTRRFITDPNQLESVIGPSSVDWFDKLTASRDRTSENQSVIDSPLACPTISQLLHSDLKVGTSPCLSPQSPAAQTNLLSQLTDDQPSDSPASFRCTPDNWALAEKPTLGLSPCQVVPRLCVTPCVSISEDVPSVVQSLGLDDSVLSWSNSLATPSKHLGLLEDTDDAGNKTKETARVLFSPGTLETTGDSVLLLDSTFEEDELSTGNPSAENQSTGFEPVQNHSTGPESSISQAISQSTRYSSLTHASKTELYKSSERSKMGVTKSSMENWRENFRRRLLERSDSSTFSSQEKSPQKLRTCNVNISDSNSQIDYLKSDVKLSPTFSRRGSNYSLCDDSLTLSSLKKRQVSSVDEVLSDFFDPPSGAVGRRKPAPRNKRKSVDLEDELAIPSACSTPKDDSRGHVSILSSNKKHKYNSKHVSFSEPPSILKNSQTCLKKRVLKKHVQFQEVVVKYKLPPFEADDGIGNTKQCGQECVKTYLKNNPLKAEYTHEQTSKAKVLVSENENCLSTSVSGNNRSGVHLPEKHIKTETNSNHDEFSQISPSSLKEMCSAASLEYTDRGSDSINATLPKNVDISDNTNLVETISVPPSSSKSTPKRFFYPSMAQISGSCPSKVFHFQDSDTSDNGSRGLLTPVVLSDKKTKLQENSHQNRTIVSIVNNDNNLINVSGGTTKHDSTDETKEQNISYYAGEVREHGASNTVGTRGGVVQGHGLLKDKLKDGVNLHNKTDSQNNVPILQSGETTRVCHASDIDHAELAGYHHPVADHCVQVPSVTPAAGGFMSASGRAVTLSEASLSKARDLLETESASKPTYPDNSDACLNQIFPLAGVTRIEGLEKLPPTSQQTVIRQLNSVGVQDLLEGDLDLSIWCEDMEQDLLEEIMVEAGNKAEEHADETLQSPNKVEQIGIKADVSLLAETTFKKHVIGNCDHATNRCEGQGVAHDGSQSKLKSKQNCSTDHAIVEGHNSFSETVSLVGQDNSSREKSAYLTGKVGDVHLHGDQTVITEKLTQSVSKFEQVTCKGDYIPVDPNHQVGFTTVSGTKVKLKDTAIAKARSLLQDVIESEDVFSENTNNSFQRIKSSNSMSNEGLLAKPNIFEVNSTEGMKKDHLDSPNSSSKLDELKDVNKKLIPKINKSTLSDHSNSKDDFVGFKTASNKHVRLSTERLLKAKTLFDSDLVSFTEIKDDIAPSTMHSFSLASGTRNAGLNNGLNVTGGVTCGFASASGKSLNISSKQVQKASPLLSNTKTSEHGEHLSCISQKNKKQGLTLAEILQTELQQNLFNSENTDVESELELLRLLKKRSIEKAGNFNEGLSDTGEDDLSKIPAVNNSFIEASIKTNSASRTGPNVPKGFRPFKAPKVTSKKNKYPESKSHSWETVSNNAEQKKSAPSEAMSCSAQIIKKEMQTWSSGKPSTAPSSSVIIMKTEIKTSIEKTDILDNIDHASHIASDNCEGLSQMFSVENEPEDFIASTNEAEVSIPLRPNKKQNTSYPNNENSTHKIAIPQVSINSPTEKDMVCGSKFSVLTFPGMGFSKASGSAIKLSEKALQTAQKLLTDDDKLTYPFNIDIQESGCDITNKRDTVVKCFESGDKTSIIKTASHKTEKVRMKEDENISCGRENFDDILSLAELEKEFADDSMDNFCLSEQREVSYCASTGEQPVPSQDKTGTDGSQLGKPGEQPVPSQDKNWTDGSLLGKPGEQPVPSQDKNWTDGSQLGKLGEQLVISPNKTGADRSQLEKPGEQPVLSQDKTGTDGSLLGKPGEQPVPSQDKNWTDGSQLGKPGEQPVTSQDKNWTDGSQLEKPGEQPVTSQDKNWTDGSQLGKPGEQPVSSQNKTETDRQKGPNSTICQSLATMLPENIKSRISKTNAVDEAAYNPDQVNPSNDFPCSLATADGSNVTVSEYAIKLAMQNFEMVEPFDVGKESKTFLSGLTGDSTKLFSNCKADSIALKGEKETNVAQSSCWIQTAEEKSVSEKPLPIAGEYLAKEALASNTTIDQNIHEKIIEANSGVNMRKPIPLSNSFQTASGKMVMVSELAIRRAKEHLMETEITEKADFKNSLPVTENLSCINQPASMEKFNVSALAFEIAKQIDDRLPEEDDALMNIKTSKRKSVNEHENAILKAKKRLESDVKSEQETAAHLKDSFQTAGSTMEKGNKNIILKIPTVKIVKQDPGNGTVSSGPTHTTSECTNMFQTASGKSVAISDAAFLKAKQNLEKDDESVRLTGNSLSNTFQTACGKHVLVSEEAFAKAKQNLETDDGKEEVKARGLLNMAGRMSVVVTEEALAKTEDTLETVVNKEENQAKEFSNTFQTASGMHLVLSKKALVEAKQSLEANDGTKDVEMCGLSHVFQTASGKNVAVSKEALAEAKQSLEADFKKEINEDAAFTNIFQTASGRNVALLDDAMKLAKQTLDIEEFKQCEKTRSVANMFQTASGRRVIVSEQALINAKQTLEGSNDKKENTVNSFSSLFKTASGKCVEVCEKSLHLAKQSLDNANTEKNVSTNVFSNMFLSASRDKVQVSEQDFIKAKESLDHDCTIDAVKSNSCSNMFQTANERNVSISEKALMMAKQNLDMRSTDRFSEKTKENLPMSSMFQTAGGKSVQVSNQALQMAKHNLDVLRQDNASDNGRTDTNDVEAMNGWDITNESSTTDLSTTEQVSDQSTEKQCLAEFGISIEDLIPIKRQKLDQNREKAVLPKVTESDLKLRRRPLKSAPEGTTTDRRHPGFRPFKPVVCRQLTRAPVDPAQQLQSLIAQKVAQKPSLNIRASFLTPYRTTMVTNSTSDNLSDGANYPSASKNTAAATTPVFISRSKTSGLNDHLSQHQNVNSNGIRVISQHLNVSSNDSIVIRHLDTDKPSHTANNVNKILPAELSSCVHKDFISEKVLQISTHTEMGTNSSVVAIETKELPPDVSSVLPLTTATMETSELDTSSQDEDDMFCCQLVEFRQQQAKLVQQRQAGKVRATPGRLIQMKEAGERMHLVRVIDFTQIGPAPKVTAMTAVDHRFHMCDHYGPQTASVWVGDGALLVPDNNGYVGKQEFYTAFLTLEGVDQGLITEVWLYNHYRWIIWKLASYEVTSSILVGRCLNPENVMLQLKYRYDREVDRAQRSSIKKIFERDDTASKRLVLCVCGIQTVETGSKPRDQSKMHIQLTDGWYSIGAQLDAPLSDLVMSGCIYVGQKLCMSGAELVGGENACSPLESAESVTLKISYNACRPAPWDCRLGYQDDPRPLCVPITGLMGEGGMVGVVDVIIVRKYPIMYMEKLPGGGCVFRTSSCEMKIKRDHESRRQTQMERLYGEMERAMEKEHISDKSNNRRKWTERQVADLQTGEEVYKAIRTSLQPDTVQGYLSAEQMSLYWEHLRCLQEDRQIELKARVQKVWEEQHQDTGERVVTPVLKFRLAGCSRRDLDTSANTILTVWRPSSEIADLQEGRRYKIYSLNTSTSRSKYTGHSAQLTATKQTCFRLMQLDENFLDSVYEPREVLRVNDIRRRQPPYGELDFVGMVIRVISAGDGSNSVVGRGCEMVHLADSQGDVLTVRFWNGYKSFGVELFHEGSLLCCSNLMDKAAYRQRQGVPSVEACTEFSHFSNKPQQKTHRIALDKLLAAAKDSRDFIEKALVKLNDGIQQLSSIPQKSSATDRLVTQVNVASSDKCSGNTDSTLGLNTASKTMTSPPEISFKTSCQSALTPGISSALSTPVSLSAFHQTRDQLSCDTNVSAHTTTISTPRDKELDHTSCSSEEMLSPPICKSLDIESSPTPRITNESLTTPISKLKVVHRKNSSDNCDELLTTPNNKPRDVPVDQTSSCSSAFPGLIPRTPKTSYDDLSSQGSQPLTNSQLKNQAAQSRLSRLLAYGSPGVLSPLNVPIPGKVKKGFRPPTFKK